MRIFWKPCPTGCLENCEYSALEMAMTLGHVKRVLFQDKVQIVRYLPKPSSCLLEDIFISVYFLEEHFCTNVKSLLKSHEWTSNTHPVRESDMVVLHIMVQAQFCLKKTIRCKYLTRMTFEDLHRYYCVGIHATIFTSGLCKSAAPLGWNMQMARNF